MRGIFCTIIRSFHSIYIVVDSGVLQEFAGKVGHRDQLITHYLLIEPHLSENALCPTPALAKNFVTRILTRNLFAFAVGS